MSTISEKVKKIFVVDVPEDLPIDEAKKEVNQVAIPAILEAFLLQLASMVDTFMVSSVSEYAIAAINYSSQPRHLTQIIFIAMHTGTTALVSRFRGSDERGKANTVLRQTIIMTIFLSIFVSIVGYIFAEKMVVAMGADLPFTIKNGTDYFKIQMIGFPFVAVTMAITASLRGIGLTKITLIYNILSNIVNVIFNYILINGKLGFPVLGVKGASIATILGQVVAFIIAIVYISRTDNYLVFRFRHLFVIKIEMIKRIIKIAIPAMFEQIVMRIGMIVYILIINSLGADIVTTNSIALQLLSFSYLNGQSFGISATSLLGRSLGQERPDHAKAYVSICKRNANILAYGLVFCFAFFGKGFMALFTKNQDIIDLGGQVLLIVAVLQPMQASQLVLNGALRGAGDTKTVANITMIGILVIRPLLTFILVYVFKLGLMGAWIGMTADQVTRYIYSKYRFESDKWMTIKV